jgi:hypothetical protein
MTTRTTIVAAASAVLFATPAFAQSASTSNAVPSSNVVPASAPVAAPVESSPDRVVAPAIEGRRHEGFFSRMYLGGGYRSLTVSGPGGSASYTGGGVSFGVSMGGAVTENLIVLGDLMIEEANSPKFESPSLSIDANGATMSCVGLGPGIAYYFTPSNLHIGASLLLAKSSVDFHGESLAETDWGYGAVARVGKDFWLGKHLSIGVLGQLSLASMPDKANSASRSLNWSAVNGSIAFSASYN